MAAPTTKDKESLQHRLGLLDDELELLAALKEASGLALLDHDALRAALDAEAPLPAPSAAEALALVCQGLMAHYGDSPTDQAEIENILRMISDHNLNAALRSLVPHLNHWYNTRLSAA